MKTSFLRTTFLFSLMGIAACGSNPGSDAISNHGPYPAGTVSDCGGCHSVAMGSRRAVMGANGDFGANPARTSHHVVGPVDPTAAQCLVCHNIDEHGSGTVRLTNADTGAVIPVTSRQNMETFCLSCHDATGANGNMGPFADGAVLGDLYRPNVSGYPTTNQTVTTGWTDPDRTYADDSVYATASPAINATIDSRWSGFSFDSLLPAPPYTARIDSVRILAEYHVSTNTSLASLVAQATVSGTDCPAVAQVHSAEPLTDFVATFDVTSCRAWTRNDLLDGTFQVRIGARRGNSATPVDFYLDHVRVEVTYNSTGFKASSGIQSSWGKTYGHRQKGLTCIGSGDPNTGCHSNGHGSAYVGILARNMTMPLSDSSWFSPASEFYYELCFTCHQSYPNVTKEAILGYRLGGNYDIIGDGPPPYDIPNIMTQFRDRYDSSGLFYDDGGSFTAYSNLHYFHIQGGAWRYRDVQSSTIQCIACHNVHGSNTQWGSVHDEFVFGHFSGAGLDQYGMIGAPMSSLSNYPFSCSFNCHTFMGTTHSWFAPPNE